MGFLTVEEQRLAKYCLLRHLQASSFPVELESQQENGTVLRKSKLALSQSFLSIGANEAD